MADGEKADGKFFGEMNAVLKTVATMNEKVECMLLQQIQLGYLRLLKTTRYKHSESYSEVFER